MGYNNKNNQSNDIIIDDGSKSYNIKNKQGQILGKFVFRPTDTNIISRYDEVVAFLSNLKNPSNDEESKKIQEDVVGQISYLINADAKDAFFTILGAFSPLPSGELFVENVVNAIAAVIDKEFDVSVKRVQRRANNKYTAKYHK